MYRSTDYEYEQLCFLDFNSTCGMQLNPDNEWVKAASRLPWQSWETLYAAIFPKKVGNVAKPCRMVLGSLILQLRLGLTDRELVNQLAENPYYQYFIGLRAFQMAPPFVPTLLVEWRKRVNLEFVIKANDVLCDSVPRLYYSKGRGKRRGTLLATQICDATVAPQYIRYPQDTSLLNEAREKLEAMIDWFCEEYGLQKPRTYRKKAHKEYLSFAKSKKPSAEKIRAAIKAQLSYVRRDMEYLDDYLHNGYVPLRKFAVNVITIHKLYDQQKYMYENRLHAVEDRIVSISQPYVRPIMRGKASKPTEFGAKLHLSIEETGFARIENISFDAFNEGPQLIDALNAYAYRNGQYPARVLVDQIYRTRANLEFCKEHDITVSGPKLGRPAAKSKESRAQKRSEARDQRDRIEVERYFSTAKRRNGMGLINRKREDTSLSTIAMAVLVTNIFGSFSAAISEYENHAVLDGKADSPKAVKQG